jgi:DNA-binding response OmpR family regulator
MTSRPLHSILIVDDDALVRRPLEMILRKEGFEPLVASDATECLALLAGRTPDLILLDVMMPGRNGFELCHAIKQEPRWAGIPIILLSARALESDRERGLGLGAADYLSKPYSPAELIARIRQLLAASVTNVGS